MKQTIKHGAILDALTPDEATAMLASIREQNASVRVRAMMTLVLDAAGNGQDEVYVVPMGFEFEARRVFADLDTAANPFTGRVAFAAASFLEYLRSGQRIEYAATVGPTGTGGVPGMQTWGAEQGPYLRNGEVLEVKATGMTPNATLKISLEGILKRPRALKGAE